VLQAIVSTVNTSETHHCLSITLYTRRDLKKPNCRITVFQQRVYTYGDSTNVYSATFAITKYIQHTILFVCNFVQKLTGSYQVRFRCVIFLSLEPIFGSQGHQTKDPLVYHACVPSKASEHLRTGADAASHHGRTKGV